LAKKVKMVSVYLSMEKIIGNKQRSLFLSLTFILLMFMNKHIVNAQPEGARVLVLIHSDNGNTYTLSKEVAEGIQKDGKTKAIIKLVQKSENAALAHLAVASPDELDSYDGIAFGSPVYFGNISTAMSAFLAKTVELWTQHRLEGIPATVFMAAGSGAGRELAIQAFWNSLAVHGMVLVPNGIRGVVGADQTIPQGFSVLGASSLMSNKVTSRPSDSERYMARLQGENFAKIAGALKGTRQRQGDEKQVSKPKTVADVLQEKHIELPNVPQPAGNYVPYVRSGNLIFINQVALKDGKIQHPGKLGVDITEEQVKEATRTTLLNVVAVLKDAVNGDLDKVVRCVQLTGIFNTTDTYTQHAQLMNTASDLVGEIFGDKGKHARATFGASSIPVNSPVEIQAIFEVQ